MRSKITVFTSPTCPHCPGAVKLVKEVSRERDDVVVEVLSTATHKGSKKARELEKLGKIVIVEGRVQFHFLPESIKVYIKVN